MFDKEKQTLVLNASPLPHNLPFKIFTHEQLESSLFIIELRRDSEQQRKEQKKKCVSTEIA